MTLTFSRPFVCRSEVLFKLELHADAMAAIFGYDGLTITTIRERTKCRMKLLSGGSDPSMRALSMSGTQDACLQACGLVLAEMQKSCASNTNVCVMAPDGPQYSVKVLVRSDACGCIIGKGGATINGMRQASGATIKVEQADGNSYEQAVAAASAGLEQPSDRTISIGGLITSVHAAVIDVIPRVTHFLRQAKTRGFVGFGGTAPPPGYHNPSGTTREQAQAGGVHPLEQGPGYVHAVPGTAIGRVIGPGGTQIREIRDKTGARVRVGNDKIPGTQDRPVTIWGTQEQVQQVMAMIAEITSRPDDRPPRQPKPQGYAPQGYAPPYGAPPAQYGAPPPGYNPYAPPPAPPPAYNPYAPPPPGQPASGYGAPPPPGYAAQPPASYGSEAPQQYAPPPGYSIQPPPASSAPAAPDYSAQYAAYYAAQQQQQQPDQAQQQQQPGAADPYAAYYAQQQQQQQHHNPYQQ